MVSIHLPQKSCISLLWSQWKTLTLLPFVCLCRTHSFISCVTKKIGARIVEFPVPVISDRVSRRGLLHIFETYQTHCSTRWRHQSVSGKAAVYFARQQQWKIKTNQESWSPRHRLQVFHTDWPLSRGNGGPCRSHGPPGGQAERTDDGLSRGQHWHRRAGVGQHHKEAPERRGGRRLAAPAFTVDLLAGQVGLVSAVYGFPI